MPVLDGLNFNTAGALARTDATGSTVAQLFQKNGRAVAANFSLYYADAPASKGATDNVKQGVLMRADNVVYLTTTLPTTNTWLPSGIKVRADRVVYAVTSPVLPLRAAFDPLIGTVKIDANGGVYVQ